MVASNGVPPCQQLNRLDSVQTPAVTLVMSGRKLINKLFNRLKLLDITKFQDARVAGRFARWKYWLLQEPMDSVSGFPCSSASESELSMAVEDKTVCLNRRVFDLEVGGICISLPRHAYVLGIANQLQDELERKLGQGEQIVRL